MPLRERSTGSSPPASPTTLLKRHEENGANKGFTYISTYLGYGILVVFGHLRDFFGKLCGYSRYFNLGSKPPKGYAPLLQDWENFYTRRLYHRIQDCWNRPIAGPPYSNKLEVVARTSGDGNKTMTLAAGASASAGGVGSTSTSTSTSSSTSATPTPITTTKCINLGSYNYLGFADDWEATCKDDVMRTAGEYPTSMCSSPGEGGYSALHRELEVCVADYVGKEAACVFNMGWATNALGLPALLGGKGTLIVSDSLNHNSLVAGARMTGASVRVFRHNDLASLEEMLQAAVCEGQERTRRPWRRILVAVEGIYSMEGEFCDLAGIIRVAKAHKCYVYLDEAHSIGATGRTGRGVCEWAGVDPKDVDILMGTFTKSFGAMGGYIAGSASVVAWVKERSAGFLLDSAMAPAVAQQVLTAFKVMKGEDGTDTGARKLAALKDNANYFRARLKALGCEVMGDDDSPVIPLLLYNPTKIAAFSRECLKRGLAVVVVGFPATPLVSSRVRFCLSAGHTREKLDEALEIIEEVVDLIKLRYNKYILG